jgi:quercetin dioxygenase-like cupin family protein
MEPTLAPTGEEVVDLAKAVTPPVDGIMSRAVFQDSQIKAVVFGFGSGQELSEHTASRPAIMHFLEGEADVTVGQRQLVAGAGTWIHMESGLSHSIVAKSPVIMLLLLLK